VHHLLLIKIKITSFFLKLSIRDLPKVPSNISTLPENQRSEIQILLNGINLILLFFHSFFDNGSFGADVYTNMLRVIVGFVTDVKKS
jgi:hypothetical protein